MVKIVLSVEKDTKFQDLSNSRSLAKKWNNKPNILPQEKKIENVLRELILLISMKQHLCILCQIILTLSESSSSGRTGCSLQRRGEFLASIWHMWNRPFLLWKPCGMKWILLWSVYFVRHGVQKRVLALVLHVSIVEKQVLTITLPISCGSTKHFHSVPQYTGKDKAMKRVTF